VAVDIEQIDRYCDLFEQRLKAGEAGSVEEFLSEQGLPRNQRLVAELLRLKHEYGAGGSLDETLQAAAETITLEPPAQPSEPSSPSSEQPAPRRDRSIDETEARPPQSLTGTQEWNPERTWSRVFKQPNVSITTSLKAEIAAHPESQSNLVIQRRAIKEPEASPHQPADYDLLKLLGKGGMGIVYAARQGSLDRTVAVKMLKPKGATDAGARNEFLAEACVTGDLEHPNIVPVYDLGRDANGNFFYAMKRVQGTPWKDVIGEKPLHENLEILMRVSDAIAFAHSKGIVHRDLKPENIMLGGFGEVLVMDWGLAIPTDMNRPIGGIRKAATMGGTPTYMAPEMAAGPFERIGPASDIYLLGAILYEITTGLRPHHGKNVADCIYAASRNVIQPTEKKGELIDIALRAMEFEPKDRYSSVKALQDAIRDYQSHSESITLSNRAADHLSNANQSRAYEDYSRAMFGFQQALELWEGNQSAAAGLLETRLAYAKCAQAKGDYDLGSGLLDASIPEQATLRDEILVARREREARQQRLQTYKKIGAALVATFLVVVSGLAFWINLERAEARRQEKLAKHNEREANKQRDEAERQEAEAKRQEARAEANATRAENNAAAAIAARKAEAYEAYVARIGAAVAKIEENAYDNARELLAAAIPAHPDEEDHRHWEWGRLSFLCQQEVKKVDAGFPLESVAYSVGNNGLSDKFVAGGSDGKARIWSVDGAPVAEIDSQAERIHALAFSPNGRQIAAGTNNPSGLVQLFSAETGALETTLVDPTGKGHLKPVLSVEYSPDGTRLLTSSEDGTAKVWDLAAGTVLSTLHGHRWWVWQARFGRHAEGTAPTKIVTASHDGTAIVWTDPTGAWNDPAAIAPSPPFRGHEGPIYAAAFASDGRTVATAGHDQRVLVWQADQIAEFDYDAAFAAPPGTDRVGQVSYRALVGHTAPIRSLDFSRDGRIVVSGGHDNAIKVWSVDSGTSLKTLRGHGQWVRACVLSPDSREVLSASFDGTVRRWDIAGYEEVRVLRGRVLVGHDDSVLRAEYSRDGQWIVTAGRDRTAKVWSARTGEEQRTYREGHAFLASKVDFSADGTLMASAAVDATVRLWKVQTGRQLHVLRDTGRGAAVAVSRDGQRVLTGGPDVSAGNDAKTMWLAKLWDASSGEVIHELRAHFAPVTAVAISADGALLYTGDASGASVLWDAQTGQRLAQDAWHTGKIVAAEFAADGRLVTASEDNSVARRGFRAGSLDEPQKLLHPDGLISMDCDGAGQYVATTCLDNQVRLWDFDTGEVIRTFTSESAVTNVWRRVALAPDGSQLLVVDSAARTVRLFDVASGSEVMFPLSKTEVGPFLLLPEQAQLWSASFLPDGQHVVTAGGDQVRLWEVNEEQLPYRRLRMNFSPHGVVASAGFSTSGDEIISASWDGTAIIWDVRTGNSLRKLGGYHAGPLNWAVFSPDLDSSLVLTASDDRTAILWDARSGQFVRRFAGQGGPVRCVAFSPDSQLVLTASDDGVLLLWDIDDGHQPWRRLDGHGGPVLHAVFSADGKLVLSGSADNTAIVWDVQTGTPRMTLRGHTAAVNSVAFSADGKRAVTGSADFTAKVWDVTRQVNQEPPAAKELLTLSGHDREVTSVAFSPDGLSILTASHDGTAIIYTAAPWFEKVLASDPRTADEAFVDRVEEP